MCDHCFNASDFQLPSGTRVCRDCFYESYCACCWEPTTQVGDTNEDSFCATCINNNLPQQRMYHHIVNDNIILNINNIEPIINIIETDDDYDGTFDVPLIDEYLAQGGVEDEPWPVQEIPDDVLQPPPEFDMNMASSIEENPDYMDNLINGQVEHEGYWYFSLGGQIYTVPYEIEIDDDHVRRDIINNWDGVQWRGTIFGNYIAWY